jgi:hypothetical protein
MRRLRTYIVALGILVALPAAARAQENGHPFGMGLMIGEPIGLSAKLYLGGRPFALDFGLGVVTGFLEDGIFASTDIVWHPVILAREPSFTLPFYIGVGARVLQHDFDCYRSNGITYCDHATHIGVRGPVGVLMDFNRVQLDVFFELAVAVDPIIIEDNNGPLVHDNHRADLNAEIGVRYYF